MRTAAGMKAGIQPVLQNTWKNNNRLFLGKVVATHPEHNTVDIATERGGFLRNVVVLSGGGTKETHKSLPQVLPKTITQEPEKIRIIDEYTQLERRDTMAVIAYVNGTIHYPVCWLYTPDFEEGSFGETNLSIDRYAGDTYEAQYSQDNPTQTAIQGQIQSGTGTDGDETDPAVYEYPRQANWERVFPDRRRLGTADSTGTTTADFEPAESVGNATNASLFPLGLETYEKVGYGYDGTGVDNSPPTESVSRPMGSSDGVSPGIIGVSWKPQQDFQELPASARPMTYPDGVEALNRRPLGYAEQGIENFDQDVHPWRRHTENSIKFARGIRLNQRWGTVAELTRSGDVRILAEGLNKNVDPEMDSEDTSSDAQATLMAANPDWGSTYVFSRIEERHIAKGEWALFRKRWEWGGQLEDVDTNTSSTENDPTDVRRWGQSRTRTQRQWETLSRMDATIGARNSLTISAGSVDDPTVYAGGVWSRTDPANGGDAPRYQDRLAWRNPDSDELGNILIQSIRPALTDFGSDTPTRDNNTGGTISVITQPKDGNNASILLKAMAAQDGANLTGIASSGNVPSDGTGDQATVSFQALAWKDASTAALSALSGASGTDGNNATVGVSAVSGKDDATASITSKTGGNGSGSNATTIVSATAEDNNALVKIIAETINGYGASVEITSKPGKGPASLSFNADSPDGSTVSFGSSSTGGGNMDLSANDDLDLSALTGDFNATAGKGIALNAQTVNANAVASILLQSGTFLNLIAQQLTLQGILTVQNDSTFNGNVAMPQTLTVNNLIVTGTHTGP